MTSEVVFSFEGRLAAEDFAKEVHDKFPGIHLQIKDIKDQD